MYPVDCSHRPRDHVLCLFPGLRLVDAVDDFPLPGVRPDSRSTPRTSGLYGVQKWGEWIRLDGSLVVLVTLRKHSPGDRLWLFFLYHLDHSGSKRRT